MDKKTRYIFCTIILVHFANSEQVDTLSYYEKFNNAVISYKEGRYSLAASKFSNILSNDRSYRDPASQLMMAKSQYHLKLYQKAHRSCKSILNNYPNSPYEHDALVLMGDIALQENNETKAFKHYLKARPQIEDLLFLNEIDQRIYNCIGMGVKEESLEGLLFKEKNQFNRAIINLSRAYRAWMSGNDYDLEFIINDIDTFYLPGHFSSLFDSLKRIINEQNKKPMTIAVLLPLSGSDKNQGLSYLLGLSEFLTQSDIDKSIRFLVFDTRGLVVNTIGTINNLSSNPEVISVLGPLTRDEVISLSGIKLQLPILIPKSELSSVADIAENLFFLSPSNEIIAKRTAEIIIKELNLERIAILSPGNGQIKSLTDHFINACRQLGKDPVAVEWYIEKPEDISRQLKNIRSTAWDLVPEEEEDFTLNLEIDSLDALFDVDVTDFFELPSEDKVEEMDKKDSAKVILETIDAFYIPIRPDELTFVGTQLPLYNFNTVFFGNENWLEMSLLNQEVIGPHFQGMKIVSDVNSAVSNGDKDTFANYYSLATDHVSFIYSIIEQGISKRKHFLENLKNNIRYDGSLTSVKFIGQNKNLNGSAQVIEYSNNKLKKIGIYNGEEFIQSSE